MIDVVLAFNNQSAQVTWRAGEAVQVAGEDALVGFVQSFITPGSGSAYNAARGGLYEGFDPMDGIQVWDAVEKLGRRPGWSLAVRQKQLPAVPQATLYPDDKDTEAMLRLYGPELYARRFDAMPEDK